MTEVRHYGDRCKAEINSARAVVVIEAVPKPPPWLAEVAMPLYRKADAKQPGLLGSESSPMPPRDDGNVSTITHNKRTFRPFAVVPNGCSGTPSRRAK